jgi:methylmalonyl-CoA decarboxylase subunit alpha
MRVRSPLLSKEAHDGVGAHPVLTEAQPNILFQNWGKNLDGASLVTGILKRINGRDVACTATTFTVRAGSMDATNGQARAPVRLAGERGIPWSA